jgi:hypothetical protein
MNSFQCFKEEINPMFFQILHKIGREGLLPKSFYEARVPYNKRKERHNKKNSLMDIVTEFLSKILANQIE